MIQDDYEYTKKYHYLAVLKKQTTMQTASVIFSFDYKPHKNKH